MLALLSKARQRRIPPAAKRVAPLAFRAVVGFEGGLDGLGYTEQPRPNIRLHLIGKRNFIAVVNGIVDKSIPIL